MSRAPYLVSLELPGLGSDELLGKKLLKNCTVWKFQDFSVIQFYVKSVLAILEVLVLAIFGALNFVN